jgi:hypothetical protein
LAFRDDAGVDELRDFFAESIDEDELTEAYKKGDSLTVIFDNAVRERIYDIAQDMGSILEEIERNNHTADRINE